MPELSCRIDGHTAVVTIDNPAKRNAITVGMWEDFVPLMARLTEDDAVKVVVLTGAGENFSAGSDIAALDQLGDARLPVAAEAAVAECPKPVIAAIRGFCLGGGCEIATACDLRITGDDARFSVPPANLGIIYPLSATERLVNLIGPAATKHLMFTGEPIGAARALHIGLVDEVVAPDTALDRALHVADRIASRSQLTVQASKEVVDGLAGGRPDVADVAAGWLRRANHGPDLAEGRAAFLERRTPDFSWTRHTPDAGLEA
ncbi:enoyl-CoA hydratase/isomerase family protein [Mariniluteicoccus endophyticus]